MMIYSRGQMGCRAGGGKLKLGLSNGKHVESAKGLTSRYLKDKSCQQLLMFNTSYQNSQQVKIVAETIRAST